MSWAVEFYEDETGNRPVEEFLERLSDEQVGKVLQVFEMLEEWGPRLPFPYSSQVEGRLRELRVHYGRTLYRVFYYGDARRTFVLLHALRKDPRPSRTARFASRWRAWRRIENGKVGSCEEHESISAI